METMVEELTMLLLLTQWQEKNASPRSEVVCAAPKSKLLQKQRICFLCSMCATQTRKHIRNISECLSRRSTTCCPLSSLIQHHSTHIAPNFLVSIAPCGRSMFTFYDVHDRRTKCQQNTHDSHYANEAALFEAK